MYFKKSFKSIRSFRLSKYIFSTYYFNFRPKLNSPIYQINKRQFCKNYSYSPPKPEPINIKKSIFSIICVSIPIPIIIFLLIKLKKLYKEKKLKKIEKKQKQEKILETKNKQNLDKNNKNKKLVKNNKILDDCNKSNKNTSKISQNNLNLAQLANLKKLDKNEIKSELDKKKITENLANSNSKIVKNDQITQKALQNDKNSKNKNYLYFSQTLLLNELKEIYKNSILEKQKNVIEICEKFKIENEQNFKLKLEKMEAIARLNFNEKIRILEKSHSEELAKHSIEYRDIHFLAKNLNAKVSQIEKSKIDYLQISNIFRKIKQIENALEKGKSYEKLIVDLENLTKHDIVFSNFINSLSPELKMGTMSFKSLHFWYQKDFEKPLRQAILLKNNFSPLNVIASYFISKLSSSEKAFVNGENSHYSLSRIGYFLKKKDLKRAVKEIDKFDGFARQVSSRWAAEARKNLEMQQAMKVAKIYWSKKN